MKKILTLALFSLTAQAFSQIKSDTTQLKEVIIRPYFSAQPLLRSTGAVGVLNQDLLDKQPGSSLVSAVNTIAGVRMEERSPGSYRLSVRGSLLRSPFGIRNIKIYFDGLPLTDAGGNTYLNALDIAAAGSIEVLKGPQSSIYGANSGGVILIEPAVLKQDSIRLNANLTGGSYGLFRENVNLGKQWKNYQLNITQSYQRSDGYRDHSQMERKYFQLNQQWDYSHAANLKALIFYSDLHYDTPGALTQAQYELNPKLSRQAAGKNRSAIDQQAGIYSKTFYGGLTNTWQISPHFKHVISGFSTYTDFKNPFITNYEHRKEFTFGLRTYLEYEKKTTDVNWRLNLGAEAAKTNSDITNNDNNYGTPAALQASDRLKATTNFGFANLNVDLFQRLLLELSASTNLYQYQYESLAPVVIAQRKKRFDVQIMPRAALSYLLTSNLALRASLSKGYSPPAIAEIRASDNVINADLQPEHGWNYETGFKYNSTDRRITLDVTGFYYHLKDAIVRRLNENATEYFINAGGTKQYGMETSAAVWIIPQNKARIIRGLLFSSAYTLSRFKFDNYFNRNVDLSGKDLTGVPKNVLISSIDVQLPQGFSVFLQHNYTARIPLTDANTVYAKQYHLLQTKLSWKTLRHVRVPLALFAGADNLLNQKYSLGNDLNAAGGLYFNAAATRNFYAGLALNLK